MWRLNWIHPFDDGNGRTSRIVSYVVLMIRSGFILPGTPAIPDQIVLDRSGYFRALDEADAACREGLIDVSTMEGLLGKHARETARWLLHVGRRQVASRRGSKHTVTIARLTFIFSARRTTNSSNRFSPGCMISLSRFSISSRTHRIFVP